MKLSAEMFTDRSMLVRVLKYDPLAFETLKGVPGGTFVSEARGGPGFKYVLDVTTCKRLREACGYDLVFSEEIIEWGRQKEEERIRLTNLAMATDADDLDRVKEFLPDMYPRLRSYQRAGIRFVAEAPHSLIGDDPGLGKTWEVIGGVFQCGLDAGPNLVVCPKISIENVWLKELARFQDHAIFVAPEGRKERERLLEEVEFALEVDEPFWLVINPAMMTYRRSREEHGVYDARSGYWFDNQFPFISKTKWNCIINDEAQESGIATPSSQTARAMAGLSVRKRIVMSGTPAGGKAHRLWGILHWLDPKEFTSRTRWSDQWLEKIEFYDREGKKREKFDKFDKDHEAQFYKAHAQYILRRTMDEVISEMPAITEVDMVVHMSKAQADQYERMEDEADALILKDETVLGRVRSTNVLSTYNWLKQFANARCDLVERDKVWDDELDDWVTKYKAVPRADDCPKLEAVMQILEELDIPNGEEQAVIFTQFRGMADMVTEYLRSKKIPVSKITGSVTKRTERAELIDNFQGGSGAKVMVMTTKAGGVSINLDRANTVIFLDEDWDPDKRTQAIQRVRRVSRIHHTTVYTVRTANTIETDVVRETVRHKRHINDILLDLYRQRREEE